VQIASMRHTAGSQLAVKMGRSTICTASLLDCHPARDFHGLEP
jgi:hypothetical protein